MGFVLYGLLGSVAGLFIFIFTLNGWQYVFMGKSGSLWLGPLGVGVSLVIGFSLGLLAHQHRKKESGSGGFHSDNASATLFMKRMIIISGALVGLYFLWQFAKTSF